MAIFSVMSVHPHVDAATRLGLEYLLLTNLVRRRRPHTCFPPTSRCSNHQLLNSTQRAKS